MLESYLQLFFNCMLVSTFIPTEGETTLRYMLYYGTYSKALIIAVATMGAVAGLTINWLIGKFAYSWIAKGPKFKEFEGRYAKCHAFANKYAFALLLISFFNYAEAVWTLIAGMLKVRLPMFLAIVAIAKAAYFTVYVLS